MVPFNPFSWFYEILSVLPVVSSQFGILPSQHFHDGLRQKLHSIDSLTLIWVNWNSSLTIEIYWTRMICWLGIYLWLISAGSINSVGLCNQLQVMEFHFQFETALCEIHWAFHILLKTLSGCWELEGPSLRFSQSFKSFRNSLHVFIDHIERHSTHLIYFISFFFWPTAASWTNIKFQWYSIQQLSVLFRFWCKSLISKSWVLLLTHSKFVNFVTRFNSSIQGIVETKFHSTVHCSKNLAFFFYPLNQLSHHHQPKSNFSWLDLTNLTSLLL